MKPWDKLGILISSLCIVHCVLLPILIIAFPTITTLLNLDEDKTHLLLLVFIVPAVAFAVYSGFRVHKQWMPLLWLGMGLCIVVFGTFFAHKIIGHGWEPWIVLVGSIFLVRGHLLNHHHCKHCEEEHHCVWEHPHDENLNSNP